MAENFPNLMKYKNINSQEAQQPPNKMNSKRLALRHITIKPSKDKDKKRIWRAASGK